MADVPKEQLDKEHEKGVRDGAAGGPKNEPASAFIPGFPSKEDYERNDAYDRGHDAGSEQRKS